MASRSSAPRAVHPTDPPKTFDRGEGPYLNDVQERQSLDLQKLLDQFLHRVTER
jgi:hypothetical protein